MLFAITSQQTLPYHADCVLKFMQITQELNLYNVIPEPPVSHAKYSAFLQYFQALRDIQTKAHLGLATWLHLCVFVCQIWTCLGISFCVPRLPVSDRSCSLFPNDDTIQCSAVPSAFIMPMTFSTSGNNKKRWSQNAALGNTISIHCFISSFTQNMFFHCQKAFYLT